MSAYEALFETRIRLDERIAETEAYIKILQEQLSDLKTLRANIEAIPGRVVCLNLDGSIGRSGWSPCPSSISIKTTCGVVKARRAAKSRKRRVK